MVAGYTVFPDTGCDGVPVDTLYDVHNKILLALKKNVVKKASFSAIAEEKEDHRSSTKVCMLFGSVWCLKKVRKNSPWQETGQGHRYSSVRSGCGRERRVGSGSGGCFQRGGNFGRRHIS